MINAISAATQHTSRQIRLHKIFQKGFFYPQKMYDMLSEIGQDEFVGNLPYEIFSKIKASKTNFPSAILKVKRGFQAAAEILQPVTEIETQTIIKRSKNPEFIKKYTEILKKHPDAKITIYDFGREKEVIKAMKKAEKAIQKAFKGILPQKGSIRMEYIDSGSFANVFKISFLDKSGDKVFDDHVIKVYKERMSKVRNDAINNFVVRHIIASMNDKDLKVFISSMHKGEKCSKDTLKKAMEYEFLQMKQACADIRKEKAENLFDNFSMFSVNSNMHGSLPEANAITFIRKFAGHKLESKDDLVLPDFCGIGKAAFSVAKFAEKDSQKPTRKLDLINLGIISSDTSDINPDNVINGRKVDFGGMYHSFGGELKDKLTLRYFKKIMNRPEKQRAAFVERYRKEAADTRDLTTKEKILSAVDAARIYVISALHTN